MVYCGKPSTGCGNCKSRRIKCDEARPHCQNCIKTNRDCPGYPSQADLIFRKEEPGRRRRTKKALGDHIGGSRSTSKRSLDETDEASEPDEHWDTERQRRGTDVASQNYSSLQWINTDAQRASSVSHHVQQAIRSPLSDKRATVCFETSFVGPPESKDTANGSLEGAVPMLSQTKESSALCLAIEAVATATTAHSSDSRDLVQHAAHIYGKALAAAQQAMRVSVHATSDETLMTILLFSLYESMTSLEHSTTAWARHINGAVAIVRARYVEHVENPRSLLLFRAVRTQMLMNVLGQRTPIQDFLGPRGWLSDTEDNNLPAYDLLETFIAMPDLLNRACSSLDHDDTPDGRVRVKALLQDALAAQDRLSTWEAVMPKHWVQSSTASTIYTIDDTNVEEADAWPGPMYVYKDLKVLSISNKMRVSQMLCSSVVAEALQWLDPEYYSKDTRYELAKNNIKTLVDGICYGVPLHLSAEKADVDSDKESKDIEVTDAMGAQHLIWPLYTAMKMRCIPDLQRRWLRGRLLAVTKRYGQDILRRMNGERSTQSQPTTPSSYREQCGHNEWYLCGKRASYPQEIGEGSGLQCGTNVVFAELDHQSVPNVFGQLDDVKIDPALLADDLEGSQRATFVGSDYEKDASPLSPLQPEPIPVV